jgi:hypothetical protein
VEKKRMKSVIVKRVVIAGIGLATLMKLYLAATTNGTTDVATYMDQLNKIREFGGIGTYYVRGAFNNPFNHPPFMIHLLRVLGFLANITGISFRFWLRLLPSLADIGSLIVIWMMPAMHTSRRLGQGGLLLLALCPVSIIISGYHGNTDPIFIFFVLLAIYQLGVRERALLAGLAFGMALNIKAVPPMLLPAIFFYLWPNVKKELEFVGAAGLVFLLGSMPYILQDPAVILKRVFGYSSIYGLWGWSLLVKVFYPEPPRFLHPPYDVIGIHGTFASVGKWVMLGLITAISYRMNSWHRRPPVFHQAGLIIAIFLTFTPGFGYQYLVWLVPFVVGLGLQATVIYYGMAGIFLLVDYTCFNNHFFYCNDMLRVFLRIATWGSIIFVLVRYWRALENSNIQETRTREEIV